jgi:DnaK suppressor protein
VPKTVKATSSAKAAKATRVEPAPRPERVPEPPVAPSAPSAAALAHPLRETLLARRQELLKLYRNDVRVGQESGDEGTEDVVDRANNAYRRELMFSLSDNERTQLLQVDEALRRIDAETFGICGNCGREIAPLRLKAIPWARYCVDCQELAEKGLLED